MKDRDKSISEPLTPENDTRNVEDRFKGKTVEEIVNILDSEGVELEIAIENTLRDFNMGTIVRSANAFGVRHIHVIGRRQWNKRGAMKTDAYMHIHYHQSVSDFQTMMAQKGLSLIAVDNVEGLEPLSRVTLPLKSVLIFGQEGPGLSKELIEVSDLIVAIEQIGSTRSLNVGTAAGIAMYSWLSQNRLEQQSA